MPVLDVPTPPGNARLPTVASRLILGIFILSGTAGLIYEVVWARQLVLVFGNTTQAISAILTGFFGGMAIGSALGGRIADRVRRPLRLYGLIELVLVVVVLLTPVTFRLIHEVYRGAFSSLEATPGLLALVRFALAILALAPATVLMGATLPTLTRHLSRDAAHLSESFAWLYSANTVGAIVGTIVAGFILIEALGLSGTLGVGATCSGVAGIAALVIDGRSAGASNRRATTPRTDRRATPPEQDAAHRWLRLGLLVAFASGLTSLGYQTLWTRLLASGTGNSTYVFTTILALFLVGIALGAITFSALRSRIRNMVGLLALAQIATAALAVIGAALIIPGASTKNLQLLSGTSALFGAFLPTAALIVLPATFVMGLSFPAASALVAGRDEDVGGRSGLLLAVNTTGAIAGTFLIPFVVIPAVGSPAAIGLLAIVNTAVGLVLALGGGISGRTYRFAAATGGLIAVGLLTGALALGGLFVDPSVARIERQGGTLFESREDEIASVQAGQSGGGTRQLWVTGSSMTLLTVDAKLMPVLPLIAHPQAKSALVVAFGMGTSFRSALMAGLKTDGVELVPSVPHMFGYYYDDAQTVLADPNGQVVIADGRNHVELTDRRYDIIITDPPPPIESSGVSVISSREYYEAGRAHLNPGGVMMQWVPWSGQSIDETKAHLRTFRDVYPNILVAFGSGGYGMYMLGSDNPIALDEPAIREVLARPHILSDISSAYDSPIKDPTDLDGWTAKIEGLTWISGDEVARFVGDGPLITDDHPLPEYFLLRHAYGSYSPPASPGLLEELSASP